MRSKWPKPIHTSKNTENITSYRPNTDFQMKTFKIASVSIASSKEEKSIS